MKINTLYKMNNIFYKIVNGLLYADIIFKDKFVTAFKDIKPLAPIHVLIVTNKIIPTINDIKKEDKNLIGHCFIVAAKIAKLYNISKSGYRLISNCNYNANQEIFHFHIHLIGGKYLGKII